MSTTSNTDSSGGGESKLRRPDEVTVLVVDDEPDVLTYLSSILEDAGLNVLVADDGVKALEILRDRVPDLISLDLIMPRKSGIRLLVELRRSPAWSRIPVIVVTGHARDPDVRRDLDQVLAGSSMVGSSLCLEKPITPERYLQSICDTLGVQPNARLQAPDHVKELRQQAADLLGSANAATLEAILKRLKKT